jgi:hypothetical protein
MVKKSRPSSQTRHKAQARQQKQQAKAARRLEAKQRQPCLAGAGLGHITRVLVQEALARWLDTQEDR